MSGKVAKNRKHAKHHHSIIIVDDVYLRLYQIARENGADVIVDSHAVDLRQLENSPRRGLIVLLSNNPKIRNLVLVLREPTYRTQIEFLPQTGRRHAIKALSRLAQSSGSEFPVIEKLAATTLRGSPAQAWHLSIVRSDVVDEIAAELDKQKIKIRKIIVDEEITRASALHFCQSGKEKPDTVFVSVSDQSFDLIFVLKGLVAFSRRMAISQGSEIGKRVASELRRTSVFFHRKFPEAQLSRALVHIQSEEIADSVAEEIRLANQIDSVELVQTKAIRCFDSVEATSSDLSTLQALEELRSSEIKSLEGVDTPARRQARSRRRFAPSVALASVIICGLSFFYLLTLDADLSSQKFLASSRKTEVAMAKDVVDSWNEIKQKEARVIQKAGQMNDILKDSFPVAHALIGIARNVPKGVHVDSVEFFQPPPGLDEPEEIASGWSGRIVFVTNQNYFNSKPLIDQTTNAFRSARFLEGFQQQVNVLPDSLPWKKQENKKQESCRFSISFKGRQT